MPGASRILFVRSDSYGDLILFAPLLARLRIEWPEVVVGLLLKARHRDVAALLPEGVQVLTVDADPLGPAGGASPAGMSQLRAQVEAFAPDLLVAPSYEKSWFHRAAATAAPQARRISLGPPPPDGDYPEVVPVPRSLPELRKARVLLSYLVGRRMPPFQPHVRVPDDARREAEKVLARAGLAPKAFWICNPAGTRHTSLKAWPAARLAAALAALHERHGRPVLLCGHQDEQTRLDSVAALLPPRVPVRIWAGNDGSFPLHAALAAQAERYFGHDTSTLHLAEAVGTPVIALYGGGTFPRFTPSLPGSIAIAHPLPCFGCNWDCPFGDAPCLQLLQSADVVDAYARSQASPAHRHLLRVDRLSGEDRHLVRRSRTLYDQLRSPCADDAPPDALPSEGGAEHESDLVYHLDEVRHHDRGVTVRGWCFSPRVDPTLARVWVRFVGGGHELTVPARRVLRPDVREGLGAAETSPGSTGADLRRRLLLFSGFSVDLGWDALAESSSYRLQLLLVAAGTTRSVTTGHAVRIDSTRRLTPSP